MLSPRTHTLAGNTEKTQQVEFICFFAFVSVTTKVNEEDAANLREEET